MPRWPSRCIILLIFPSWSQIITPRPINYLGHKETSFPVNVGKICCPHWNRVFSAWILSLRTNSKTWLLRFRIENSAMDRWYLVSLKIHLKWPSFLEKFLASTSLQHFQVKWSEMKFLKTAAEYIEKQNLMFH